MEMLDHNTHKSNHRATDAGAFALNASNSVSTTNQSMGSSILDSNFNEAMMQTMPNIDSNPSKPASTSNPIETGSNPLDGNLKSSTSGVPQMDSYQLTKSGSSTIPGSSPSSTEVTSTSTSSGNTSVIDDHDHAPDVSGNNSNHVSLEGLQPAKILNASRVTQSSASKLLGRALTFRGDILDSGAGANDVVIGARGNDIIFGDKGGINTITTGTGKDAIIFGEETTNRILDFDPTKDKIILADGFTTNDIMIVQGTNPGKGGLKQPLDSINNTLIVDKSSGHILGALTFVKADSLSENNFSTIANEDLDVFREDQSFSRLFKEQKGDGQLNGTLGRDKLIGGDGNDFLYLGNDSFRTVTAKSIAEFPFPNDSPGTSFLKSSLKDGVLKLSGAYQNFDAFPLFSQGEKAIDPNAKILNGSNPQALIDGFLKVPQDVEGNLLSGTHLHFSPAGDDRGNFADATVVRFLENTPKDAKSGTLKGEFELTPEEQAAFLAGNMYVNLHTNIDGDGDGRAGFPTGENRINLNKNIINFV